ncbi:tRNA (adenosine(37)-N6)-dimethylallyltransferase MiaA [Oribacterium asaccharolyticum]|uniref:tRNA (adenosine(37)-N6)-dimethylallyltransferase MiaA n=1 Tax=Oribacterium asaccharolyticum TaxID=1501332 RepID=UPI0028EDCC84|nr:tRNA (adenosine(37)-N6)-dimethylallyltransferase MiaA [Oribacterium asaccharolyticum]
MNLYEEDKPLLILAGPTAVGKSDFSVKVAKALGGECISADSIQVYKGLNIGSGKITEEEMEGIPHHLLDILNPEEDYDASAFQRMAREKVEEIYRRERLPILVGGTGFYIQAMLRDIDFQEEDEAEKERLRSKLEKEMEERGSIALHEELKLADPVSAEEIHPHNRQRIMRALEYFYLHKSPISKHNREEKEKEALYDSLFLVLNRNREDLYEGINARVEKMFQDGLISEVEAFYKKGYTEHSPGFKGIGYRELFPYLRGECSLSECKALIQQNSRHYAKRQLTWFKREKNTIFVEAENFKSREEEAEWIIEKCMSKWEFLKRS